MCHLIGAAMPGKAVEGKLRCRMSMSGTGRLSSVLLPFHNFAKVVMVPKFQPVLHFYRLRFSYLRVNELYTGRRRASWRRLGLKLASRCA